MENQEFPKGVGFAPFLHSFMSNSSISIDELAVAMTMSKYAITRLAEGKSYPTDVCYLPILCRILYHVHRCIRQRF